MSPKLKPIMKRMWSLTIIALLIMSPTVTSNSVNEDVLHPNIVRAMANVDSDTEIEFIVQYRPELTSQHLQTAEGIGIEVISIFEFIDGFFGKATASQIRDLSKQDDIFWIEHNSQMEYYLSLIHI